MVAASTAPAKCAMFICLAPRAGGLSNSHVLAFLIRSRHCFVGSRGKSRIMSEEFLALITLGLSDLGYQNVADVMPIGDQF